MEFDSLVLIFVMALGGAFIQRVTGFGSGIFMMTVLPYLLPSYGEATTLSGLLSIMIAIPLLKYIWKNIEWRKIVPILITFLIVSWIAVELINVVGDVFLKRLLGGMLILAALWFYIFNDKVHVRPTIGIQVSMGILSGFMGGFFGMQGPPAILYFLATAKDKNEYMAMAQGYFFIGNVVMTFYRAKCGFLTSEVLLGWSCGAFAVIIGVILGALVFKRISSTTLRKLVYAYMAISGLLALIS